MKLQATLLLISLCSVVVIAGAQASTQDQGQAQETGVRGYWVDPSTGLMWVGKDNAKDVNWHKAMKYCRNPSKSLVSLINIVHKHTVRRAEDTVY